MEDGGYVVGDEEGAGGMGRGGGFVWALYVQEVRVGVSLDIPPPCLLVYRIEAKGDPGRWLKSLAFQGKSAGITQGSEKEL